MWYAYLAEQRRNDEWTPQIVLFSPPGAAVRDILENEWEDVRVKRLFKFDDCLNALEAVDYALHPSEPQDLEFEDQIIDLKAIKEILP